MADEKQNPVQGGSPAFRWRLLGFFGILRAPERRLRVRFRRKFYAWAVLFFLIAGLGSLSAYSTSPSFCRSCHIMEPYYNNWASSDHATKGNVACVDCHYPPGETSVILWKKFQAMSQVMKFVTRTYSSKPYAEVADESCLRSTCHSPGGRLPIPRETRVFIRKTEDGKEIPYRFNHTHHLEGIRYGRQLRCVSCHSQIAISGSHIEVTYDTCYLCHLKGHRRGRTIEPLGGCSGDHGCHLLPSEPIQIDPKSKMTYRHADLVKDPSDSKMCSTCHQDALQGEGNVEPDRCKTCHNQVEKLNRFKETDFIHANHVTKHNTACFHCHQEIGHRPMKGGPKKFGMDCGLCHEDMHDLQRDFYGGTGAHLVPDAIPSPMYLANVDCSGCHKLPKQRNGFSRSGTELGTEKGCLDCHGKEYMGILDEVHVLLRETVQKLEQKTAAIKAALPADWEKNPDYAQLVADLKEIEHDIGFVGLARPVHNVYYGTAILQAAEERLSAIARTRKIKTEDTSRLPAISGAFCATLCHDRVNVKDVPRATVTYLNREMPHRKHVEELEMTCTACHTFGQHRTVKLKESLKCGKCHDWFKK